MNASERLLFSFTTCLSLVATSSLASADALPPDTTDCASKKAGDACTVEGSTEGTCETSTCQVNDYEHWDQDASTHPPSKTIDCLRCTAGDAGSAPSDGGAKTTGGSSDTSQPKGDTSADNGGCSVATHDGVRGVAPWLLALAVPALVSATKRRRARR